MTQQAVDVITAYRDRMSDARAAAGPQAPPASGPYHARRMDTPGHAAGGHAGPRRAGGLRADRTVRTD